MKIPALLSLPSILLLAAPYVVFSATTDSVKNDAQALSLKDEALKKYLVGTWEEDDNSDGVKTHTESTYKADGTFFGKITFEAPEAKLGAPKFAIFSGKWKIEGDISIETLESISLEGYSVPQEKKFKILDIRANEHFSQDMEDGSSSLSKRKETKG